MQWGYFLKCSSMAIGVIDVSYNLPLLSKIVEWCNGSIPVSETGDIGSNPISITNVGFSLFGKALHCECKEQGSPDSYRYRSQPIRFGVWKHTLLPRFMRGKHK
jgi:hypothetical protein